MPVIGSMRRALLEMDGGHVVAHVLVDTALQNMGGVVRARTQFVGLDGIRSGGGGLGTAQGRQGDGYSRRRAQAQTVYCSALRCARVLMHGAGFPCAD